MLARRIILLNCGNVFCLSYSRSIRDTRALSGRIRRALCRLRLTRTPRLGTPPHPITSWNCVDGRTPVRRDGRGELAGIPPRRPDLPPSRGFATPAPRLRLAFYLAARRHRRDRRGAPGARRGASPAGRLIGGLVPASSACVQLQVRDRGGDHAAARHRDPPLPAQRPLFALVGAVLAVGCSWSSVPAERGLRIGHGTQATDADRRHCDDPDQVHSPVVGATEKAVVSA